MLEKLSALRGKPVEIKVKEGKVVKCIPLQYLEEDYESYLVETIETSGGYPKNTLIEIEESQIISIKPLK